MCVCVCVCVSAVWREEGGGAEKLECVQLMCCLLLDVLSGMEE